MSFEIDYWSVGMVIYHVFFQKKPINYSKPYFNDMVIKWPKEMYENVN